VAWNPKSSTENERHSVVIKNDNTEVLVKQIAGAVAKRIVNYLEVGQQVEQGRNWVSLNLAAGWIFYYRWELN
jgi:phosphatidylserine decarboxylase